MDVTLLGIVKLPVNSLSLKAYSPIFVILSVRVRVPLKSHPSNA